MNLGDPSIFHGLHTGDSVDVVYEADDPRVVRLADDLDSGGWWHLLAGIAGFGAFGVLTGANLNRRSIVEPDPLAEPERGQIRR